MNGPCKDCEERFIGCHSVCDHYINWKKEHDKIKEEEARRKRLHMDLTHIKRVKRRKNNNTR